MSDLDSRLRAAGQHIDIVRLLYFTACKTHDFGQAGCNSWAGAVSVVYATARGRDFGQPGVSEQPR